MESKEAAKRFRESWLLSTDSEVGGYQKYWISLLGNVLGEKDVLSRISFQLPVPMAGTTKFLDAELAAAHAANDRAVLAAYGLPPDTPEPEIVSHLMKLYGNFRG